MTVVCPVCLSVTLVYCGQTVGWIKMKLGMQVGLAPGHIVLDGDPAPPSQKKGTEPLNFRPMPIVAKRLDGSRCHLLWRYASAQATLCYVGTSRPKKGGTAPNFRPMSIAAKRSPISVTAEHL